MVEAVHSASLSHMILAKIVDAVCLASYKIQFRCFLSYLLGFINIMGSRNILLAKEELSVNVHYRMTTE